MSASDRIFQVAMPLAALLSLAGCGGADGGTPRPAQEGGRVVIVEGADLDMANPLLEVTAFDADINRLLYMSLLDGSWGDGEVVYQTADENPMSLVRRYEFFGADSASLRLHLRSDARWTDGRPVTAHDAAFTLRIRPLEEVAAPTQDFNREMREIVAEDDSTLVIHYRRRYSELFYHIGDSAGRIIPRHVYEDTELSQLRSHPAVTDPARNLVTNGPMRIVEWRRGQSLVLEPNPGFEPRPTIDQIVFRIVPEETTRMIELQTGNVDVADVPFHFIDEVRSNPELRIERQDKRSYEYIAYNPKAHDAARDP